MSKIYFTADTHFNNKASIKYNKRPFVDVRHMDSELVLRINNVCKPEDTLYIIGDLCFGNWKKYKPLINCTVYEIQGNHDFSNGRRFNEFGYISNYRGLNFFMIHDSETFNECIPNKCDIIICGHVHLSWKHRLLKRKYMKDIICVNVGCDLWNWYPISIDSVIKYCYQNKLI